VGKKINNSSDICWMSCFWPTRSLMGVFSFPKRGKSTVARFGFIW
jgi:hypothetical protein